MLTPIMARIARRLELYDHPRPRKIHIESIPTMGGLAVVAAALPTAWIASSWWNAIQCRHVAALTLATLPIIIVGVWDDAFGCRVWPRLGAHVTAGTILFSCDLSVTRLTNPFGRSLEMGPLGYVVTIIWVVMIVNALNLVDGLNGLATGVGALASLCLGAIGLLRGELDTAVLGGILAGSLIGFFPYNFPRARIFLGDVGSTFIGLALATLALLENRKASTALTLLIPLVVLALPVIETISSFVRRAGRGVNPLKGDLEHIHHRLLRMGLSPQHATAALLVLTMALGVVSIILTTTSKETALLLTGGLGILAFIGWSRLSRFDGR
jgi:UDP-GlcNAc:undecaprenyl-phosphate GlcNAc-1-phosphate transferase